MTRSKKKKKRERRTGPDRHEARDYKQTRGTFAKEYGEWERGEKEGIIAPFAKSFVAISNHAYYLNVNFFSKICHENNNISSLRKSDVESFLREKITLITTLLN